MTPAQFFEEKLCTAENLPDHQLDFRQPAEPERTILVPEAIIHADGVGPSIESSPSLSGRLLVLTLGVTRIAQQQGLVVSIWGSPDGKDWGTTPLVSFPPKDYCGTYSTLLNLRKRAEVRHLQVRWRLKYWQKKDTGLLCGFFVFAEASGSRLRRQPVGVSAAAF